MPLLDGDADHASTASLDRIAPDDSIGRPVCAFDQDVRLNRPDHFGRCVFAEHRHCIHTTQSSQQFTTLRLSSYRPVCPFVAPHGGVGIEPHDERVTQGAGLLQVADVTGMQQVKDAIGEHDDLSRSTERRRECRRVFAREHTRCRRGGQDTSPAARDNLMLSENRQECFGLKMPTSLVRDLTRKV